MKKLLLTLTVSAIASTAMAADLSPACETYFTKYEGYLSKMPADQATAMKQQFDSMKAQFEAMPKDTQEQTCNQALEQLKQVEASMGMK